MEQELYQTIFDQIVGTLPKGWKRVAFYAAYIGTSYTIKYYVTTPSQKNVSCFRLDTVTRAELIHCFIGIDKELSVARAALDEDHRWTVLTLIAEETGHFKAYFDYTDISENAVAYEHQWQTKYLED